MIWPALCTVCSTVLNSALRRSRRARAPAQSGSCGGARWRGRGRRGSSRCPCAPVFVYQIISCHIIPSFGWRVRKAPVRLKALCSAQDQSLSPQAGEQACKRNSRRWCACFCRHKSYEHKAILREATDLREQVPAAEEGHDALALDERHHLETEVPYPALGLLTNV